MGKDPSHFVQSPKGFLGIPMEEHSDLLVALQGETVDEDEVFAGHGQEDRN